VLRAAESVVDDSVISGTYWTEQRSAEKSIPMYFPQEETKRGVTLKSSFTAEISVV
jgi:hypothetical protein